MRKIRSADGRVHFSELRHMSDSAAHYRYACEHKREPTRAMIVGAIADAIVFEHRRVAVFDGVRRGKAWEEFLVAHPKELLCSAAEYAVASGAALAVVRDPVAGPIVRRKGAVYQRVVHWTDWGLECAAGIAGEGGRGGFDIIGDGFLDDLKITNDASPRGIERQILSMHWHAQGAFYSDGAKACGLDVDAYRLICVEATPPHPVTVVELLPELLDFGRRSLSKWTEMLKASEAADVWPGYVQEPVEMGLPDWVETGA